MLGRSENQHQSLEALAFFFTTARAGVTIDSPVVVQPHQERNKIMGLLDSILGAVNKQTEASGGANPLVGVLGGLLEQSGGLQGLMNKFSQAGQGNTFSSWVGVDQNQSISSDQIQKVLGSQQVSALAAKLGIDPNQASHLLAEYLPKVVDKLTPEGKIDPNADHQQGLADLIPALLQSFGGKPGAPQGG